MASLAPMESSEECTASESPKAFPFFALPAELRTQVYEELLVADASFRLGHHGPFCLVKRKPTYPTILRASRKTYFEAAPILYGSNSFFLGTIGFKPIYSFSFHASIGPHNALLIRKLVVHSTYPHLLTHKNVKRWIDSLGIEFDRLKVLAVSFEAETVDVTPMPPPTWNGHPLPLPPVTGATLQSMGNAVPATASSITASTTVTITTSTYQVTQPIINQTIPSQTTWPSIVAFPMGATLMAPSTATAVATTAITLAPSASQGIQVTNQEGHYEKCATREKSWLNRATTCNVQEFANIPNCDLRAGDRWLMYRDPSVRKLPRSRWIGNRGVVDLG
ncbi:hypothetical protein NA57DRAFT_61769 [Rhizodiscina lignyota]|uniref:Uncharacterized protein n=1 Tax=Rhizodiscina lignyota TaxID=1504668 RepID=A0A9P4I7N5_9PEZI|nr:hypothetical protein NA57DRAFT_61769 [Rhizodiscina lignyota]